MTEITDTNTIRLSGRVDSSNAAQLEAELSAAAAGTDISRHRRRGAVKEGGAADNRRRLRARIPRGSSCAGAVFGRDS